VPAAGGDGSRGVFLEIVDLDVTPLRELNQRLHDLRAGDNLTAWRVVNPKGRHNVAVGVDAPVSITIDGHVGYYCAGMNSQAEIVITGNAGPGLAENMMSGVVRVKGSASQYAGATGRGGLLVIEGDAAGRCGISMKGIDIVVRGSVGHMSAFMGQAGRLLVCGDAGEALGDSLYEARLYVRGTVAGLGADCVERPLGDTERADITELLARAGIEGLEPEDFRCYGSARQLYNFQADKFHAYG
jgi:glutamate synthase domain-containing protein 3